MSSVNKVILVGRVGNEPEVREVGGSTVANFSIATSEVWKDRESGERQEKTEWHRCNVWQKKAEFVANYVQKGALVFVEGKLQTRKWADASGQDRFITEIRVENIQLLSSKNNSSEDGPAVAGDTEVRGASNQTDDIPF